MSVDLAKLIESKRQQTGKAVPAVPQEDIFINAIYVVGELAVGFNLNEEECQTIFPIVLKQCQKRLMPAGRKGEGRDQGRSIEEIGQSILNSK